MHVSYPQSYIYFLSKIFYDTMDYGVFIFMWRTGVALVSLRLTLNIFHTFFCFFLLNLNM